MNALTLERTAIMPTVSAVPRAPKCIITADIDSSGKFATKLGEFEIQSHPGNYKYGSAQVDAFDAAWDRYAVKNTSVQVSVTKEGRGTCEVELWAMTPGRKVESNSTLRVFPNRSL